MRLARGGDDQPGPGAFARLVPDERVGGSGFVEQERIPRGKVVAGRAAPEDFLRAPDVGRFAKGNAAVRMEGDRVTRLKIGSEGGFHFARRESGCAGELGAGHRLTASGEKFSQKGGLASPGHNFFYTSVTAISSSSQSDKFVSNRFHFVTCS